MKNILQKENPLWISDIFVYSEYDFNGDKKYIYVKINHNNKIEEIGIDLDKRIHHIELVNSEHATKLQCSILRKIGNEFWWKLYNDYVRKDATS